MADFREYRVAGETVDRAVQHALREIDPAPLAMAMLTMAEEDRQIILRNMSARAARILGEDIAELGREKPGAYDKVSAARQVELLDRIRRYHRLVDENLRLTPSQPPVLEWATEEQLIRSLVTLKRYAARNGALALEPVLSGRLHPILAKGIRLYTEGWDVAGVQSVLEQMRESLLTVDRNRMDIMIEGVAALFGHDMPQVVEEKLAAFRLTGQPDEPTPGS